MNFFRALLLGIGLAVSGLANAHTFIPGAGNFINGFVHPYVILPHILVILLSGMFVGQHGGEGIKQAVLPFALSVVTGLVITIFWIWPPIHLIVLVTGLFLGLAVALGRPIPMQWLSILVVTIGLVVGLDSPQLELTGRDRFIAFFGTLVGVYFSFIAMAAITDLLKKPWMKIGIRILGSWGAAAALMVLAFIAVNWQ